MIPSENGFCLSVHDIIAYVLPISRYISTLRYILQFRSRMLFKFFSTCLPREVVQIAKFPSTHPTYRARRAASTCSASLPSSRLTSTAHGDTARIASWTLASVNPPERMIGSGHLGPASPLLTIPATCAKSFGGEDVSRSMRTKECSPGKAASLVFFSWKRRMTGKGMWFAHAKGAVSSRRTRSSFTADVV